MYAENIYSTLVVAWRQGYLEYPTITPFTLTIGKLRKTDPVALPLIKPITRSQTQAHNTLAQVSKISTNLESR
jgi:hypothetical protein